MGLEQENPVLFLEQAKEAVKQLEDCKLQAESALEREKQGKLDFEQETEALKQKIEKTIQERKKELESSYEQQLSQSDGKIKKVQEAREKAKNKGIKERVAEESAPLKQENVELKRQYHGICTREGAPLFCTTKLFAILYKPVSFAEVLGMIFLFLLFFGAIPISIYYFLVPHRILFLVGIYLLDILIFGGLYVFIGNRTVGKFRDVVNQGAEIRRKINRNKKQMKRLKKEINKDSNESHYHLEEFDDELSRLNQERNEVIAQKQNALHSFETVNQNIIRDEMENTEKERLATLKEQWQQASQERNSLEGKAQELQISITQKFEQFIGKKHLNEEDLHRMIQFLQEGQCKSLTEAVLKLEAPEVEPVLAPTGESDSE